ncbi:anti-sigma factor family protein [Planctomicrobium sp. SH664]|uniref:anti-sigma factor family protein n=1 Tax=Planctomicrobium sp. SH664 TaxID=3448125 RepID=UPI003F5C3564
MEKITRLSPEDRDNLSAYLDGELDEQATRQIESILTHNAVARNEVEILARTYDLLDSLPRPKASNEFVEKTVATAKLENFRKPLAQQAWFQTLQKCAVLGLWTAAMVATATAGYALTNRLTADPDELLLLDQLPVIQNFDSVSEVQSIDFLNRLSGEKELLQEIRPETTP